MRSTVRGLHRLGFQGAILTYAKEVVIEAGDETNRDDATSLQNGDYSQNDLAAIDAWKDNTLLTLRMASPSADFIALKLSGAGPAAVHALEKSLPIPPSLYNAALAICDLARERNIPLLVDAEQSILQSAVDKWTMDLQQRYNTTDAALVYSTYQTYRKAVPEILARDLAFAAEKNFALGVKLVRGAYLSHDPREEFWESKQQTDECFDGITEALIKRQWNENLHPLDKTHIAEWKPAFPAIDLMLATHNRPSVQKALHLQRQFLSPATLAEGSEKHTTRITYAQLLGMADEISCELIAPSSPTASPPGGNPPPHASTMPEVKVYKYATWGTLSECLKYLLRRAQENKDAVERAREGREALGKELQRRIRFLVGGR